MDPNPVVTLHDTLTELSWTLTNDRLEMLGQPVVDSNENPTDKASTLQEATYLLLIAALQYEAVFAKLDPKEVPMTFEMTQKIEGLEMVYRLRFTPPGKGMVLG